jgi:hypothetical protein
VDPSEHEQPAGLSGARRREPSGSVAPSLLMMPDGDARVALTAPLLGMAPSERLARVARLAGFADILLAPGTRTPVIDAEERAVGELVGRPALVTYEGATIHPGLLRLMVEHPLEPDERFTIYDEVGRPTGLFAGELKVVPAAMPISEELDCPEGLGPESVARLVYAEDRVRAELLVLRGEQLFTPGASLWRRYIDLTLIRELANRGRPVAQIEVAGLILAVGSGALALFGLWFTQILATASLLVGVEIAHILPIVRALRRGPGAAEVVHSVVPDAVVRPFGHAALTAALTFLLVSETVRSSVAGLVLLSVGGAAVLLSLVQARSLLRQQVTLSLEIPSSAGLARRLGLRYPERFSAPLIVELVALVLALTGEPGLPWGVLVVAGLARLWWWYVSPASPQAASSAVGGRQRPRR